MKRYLGIDVGGSSIKYAVYNQDGVKELGSEGSQVTVRDNLEFILNEFAEIINSKGKLDGVGISIPGGINSETGDIIEGGAIRVLGGINIVEAMEGRTPYTIVAENDANCVALAEKWIGAGVGVKNFVCVTIGTGIGGGIVLNNELYTGSNFFAGEFGYMINQEFDDFSDIQIMSATSASIPFIKNVAVALNVPVSTLDGKKVFAMIDEGNEVVVPVYRKWIRALSTGILNIGFALDPEKILIGGGVSVVPRLIVDINEELKHINPYSKHWSVEVCQQFNDAGSIGAAYIAMNQ